MYVEDYRSSVDSGRRQVRQAGLSTLGKKNGDRWWVWLGGSTQVEDVLFQLKRTELVQAVSGKGLCNACGWGLIQE